MPGVLVILSPARETGDSAYYRGFKSDSDGSFDFENLRPGDYRLFALEDVEFEYANPAAVKPYLTQAKALRVEPRAVLEEKVEPLGTLK